MSATWQNRFNQALTKAYSHQKAAYYAKKYRDIFPHGYKDDFAPEFAVNDIHHLELLSPDSPLQINFYYHTQATDYPLHLRLFQWQKPIPLSDILPMLENLDLRTFNERPHKIILNKNATVWISDFAVIYRKANIEIESIEHLFLDAFTKIYFGIVENDGFNKLVLGAALSWREIIILRAYAKYLKQVGFRFSQAYIEKALVNHPHIAKDLVTLFFARNQPKKASEKTATRMEENITQALDAVVSLDEDRILRRLFDLVKATLRTNYFQTDDQGHAKSYFAFKLNSRAIPELPLPTPLYEIFIYSARFEGIHLRNMKVARGGIRWSDRKEDFRTEILGLMKAQVVKNAVIVPSGAKGGFVLKAANGLTRETLEKEVIYCYRSFISGLLDLTDNIKNEKFIRPQQVVCHDDIDPYLVVAADKGTATFSDIANEIAKTYDFWLGDAFASGGRTGYDHKEMGITARGAWESIKRHFREIDIDVHSTDISVVGIGDMSGDVFGNGMIYSKRIKLVAAFDHRHIFLDPHPDPEISYYERLRLFDLPISSWEDYNPKLISKGGGVYKRSAKSIPISPLVKTSLQIQDNSLTPNDLIRAILKAPVDLLYNGGIGTYVKASHESDAEVGDRSNDYYRVDGQDLRCKVVAEGGNLGFTQLGRIEYAIKGGLINTDFIDNSAGVDCSDHEVNLKILFTKALQKKKLTLKKRDRLLASLTDEVAALVLYDNYSQALVMSFSAFHAQQNLNLHTNYIKDLETQGILSRQIEFLPDERQLVERKALGLGLTRPELASLLAYTKIHIKQALLKSDILQDPFLREDIMTAFPASIRKRYGQAMLNHRLHLDILTTQLSNRVVNQMGITFVYRLQMETSATIAEIIRAHAVASQIFNA